jgi:hypothetical protein
MFQDLTRDSLDRAIAEYNELGQRRFLEQYGYHPATRYWVVHDGRRYEPRALLAAAVGMTTGIAPQPNEGPRRLSGSRLRAIFAAVGLQLDDNRNTTREA